MATRTAIAAKDRKSKEMIAEKDRREKKRQFDKSYQLEKEMQPYKQMESASTTTKNLMQAAYGKQGLGGAMSSGKSNDPSWYKKFNLNAYSVKLPTFYRLGSVLKDKWLSDSYDCVPGIATLVWVPTLPNMNFVNSLGNTYYQTSPINQSLTRFMAELRKLNSRIGDYDPSDIGLYWYAIIGIIVKLGQLQKAIKGYNTYYAENSYLSRGFIKSCGFDPDDFYAHVQQYKAQLIKWISLFNANAVIPNSLDLIKRYAWMTTVVVREHNNANSQLYHFRCAYNLTLTDDETYVSLSQVGGLYTYLTYVSGTDSQIQNLFNSAGVVTMTADLRAAFPDAKLLKWEDFKGDEQLTYSESVHDLEQIHNARTLPSGFSISKLGNSTFNPTLLTRTNIIVDSDGYLAQGALTTGGLMPIACVGQFTNEQLLKLSIGVNSDNQFLNFFDSNDISEDSILEATRFRYTMFEYNDDFGGHIFKENGTEIISHIEVMIHQPNNPDPIIRNVFTEYYATDVAPDYTEWRTCCEVSTFDWFPWLRLVHNNDSSINTLGEIDHAVYVANDNLRIIHEGCAFSLFYVDTFAPGRVA